MFRILLLGFALIGCTTTPNSGPTCAAPVLLLAPDGVDYSIYYIEQVIAANKRGCRVRRFMCLTQVEEIGDYSFRATCAGPRE